MISSIISSLNAERNVSAQPVQDVQPTKSKRATKKTKASKPVSNREEQVDTAEEDIPSQKLQISSPVVEPPTTGDVLFKTFLQHSPIQLDESETAIVQSGIKNITNTLHGVVHICQSETCAKIHICPLVKINKVPNGSPCPVEMAIVDQLFTGYCKMLEDELGSTDFNIVEMKTIESLIEVDLEEFRSRIYAAIHGQVIESPVFSAGRDGAVIYTNAENPIYNIRERLDRRKARLLNRLLLTPESKARFKVESRITKGNRSTQDLILSAEEKIASLHSTNGATRTSST